MVARAAAAASLPSGRARRLGSGRLPLAPALPGHGAVVLAGRSVGTGHGGVLVAQFMVSHLVVLVFCGPDGCGWVLCARSSMHLSPLRSSSCWRSRLYVYAASWQASSN
jgi:hypothetical protein